MNRTEASSYIERNCSRLNALLNQTGNHHFLNDILESANPRNCAGRIDDLIGVADRDVSAILAMDRLRKLFIKTIAGSRFLFSILYRNPQLMNEFFLNQGFLIRKSRSEKEHEIINEIEQISKVVDFDKKIRQYKEREFLRIGIRDLADYAGVQEIMAELSDLASATVQCAIDFHFRMLTGRFGIPSNSNNDTGLIAIGMGKLSGKELNFSSDVDLIFLRVPEEGYTSGPEKVNVNRFYELLVQAVSRSLSQVTEDGFVFRIDLRLRPEGDKGELVPSVTNALDYYMGWGRTWERAALMKAAVIAGDRIEGQEFLKELEPFIYRKYLDYSTLEEMRAMKVQIETQLKKKPGINIKLGQGGIREIEFFVQALQLINAGRKPRIRSTSTLEGLNLLRESELIEKATAEQLRDAYIFFRKTEHRIQINHQLQTHDLPKTEEEQTELAIKMGYCEDPLNSFLKDLDHNRKIVEDVFSGLFYQSGDQESDENTSIAQKIMMNIDDESVAIKVLSDAGFEDAPGSRRILLSMLSSSDRKTLSEKAKHLLEKLAPLFLEEIIKMPEPSKALLALDSYLDSLHAHSAYFSTLLENPPTIDFITRILGESRFFTDLLIRHPQAIDSLIAKGSHHDPKSKEVLESTLEERLAYSEDFEEELDVLRRFKNEEMLVIGVNHLNGDLDSPTARKLVSELADVCLQGASDIALREMRKKFGYFDFYEPLPFVILGMGKLGGREMTYLSDLDVIFIYDPPIEQIGKLSAHEWFSRFAGRVISILNLPTAEGIVWAIDTRLRPSGNKGPLVSSITSFKDYHQTSSQLWEKQALIKARPITGPPQLIEILDSIIKDQIKSSVIESNELFEIDRLRKRMEQEIALEDKSHVDLKTGQGGLVDVEFIVKANILKYGNDFPQIIRRNTLEALLVLRDSGLIKEADFESLNSGYRFLTNLEDRLRIMEHKSIDRMPLNGDKLKALARRLNYKEGFESQLVEDYFRVTNSIRKIYDAFFKIDSN
jgi:[glutamine synthetase] adenylyltransferase / [glutamine synthetase]-adenylyl-L-tyrosine phosphorylase